MKYLEAGAGVAVLLLRLLWIPLRAMPVDWIVVLALFWIARSLAPENSKVRDCMLTAAGLWMTGIYAWHQGPHTWGVLLRF